MVAAAGSMRASERPVTTTRAPAAANARAMCRPMPRLAPVTTAIFPVRSYIVPSFYPFRGRRSGTGGSAGTGRGPFWYQ